MPRRVLPTSLMSLAFVLGAVWMAVSAPPQDDLAKELPRIPAKSPAEALKSFKIHEGFELRPIAVEPILTDPVDAVFDEDARLYVVEMRGYPYPENTPTGNVRRLVDVDGDGVYDKSTIFVPDLSWPTGIVAYDGGVFVTVAPDIFYAKDTDGDGVADIKKVMFSGFGVQNVQGLLNGLQWGTDGWIYGSSGSNGGDIKNHTKADAKLVSVRGRDYRFRPDGSVFEATSGGGQFGHSFDDWGHRFVCNNSNHMRQIILPSSYLERNPALTTSAVLEDIPVEGPAAPVYRISQPEPWRIVRTRQRAADPEYRKKLPPTELVATGFFTSATGVTIYRGTAYPPEYRGNAFIGDVGGNLVHRKIVELNGARYKATRADQKVEFLASTDNWFRPVLFRNTPGGTLAMLDMYRETIEHPFSIPEPIKKHLDLTSGKDKGRIYDIVPVGYKRPAPPKLSKATAAELVGHLAHPDGWWRETAQRLLLQRKDSAAIPLLKDLAVRRPTALGRTHALWTLGALGALDAATLLPAMSDEEPRVREQAAKLSETLLKDSPELLSALVRLADDADPMVRFQAAFSLGESKDARATGALTKIAIKDQSDKWTRAAVLSSASGRVPALMTALAGQPAFLKSPAGKAYLGELASLLGPEDDSAAREILTAYAGKDADPALAQTVIQGLRRGYQRSGRSLKLEGEAAKIMAPALAKAKANATKAGASVASRIEAVKMLSLGSPATVMEVLPDLLGAREPVALQLEVLRTLGEQSDPTVAGAILERWSSLSPTVRREALEILFARPDRLEALLGAVEKKTVATADVDVIRQRQLLADARPAIKQRASKLFAANPTSNRAGIIKSYSGALAKAGRPESGKAVYKKICATCHQAEGQGVEVGPNLATVANRTPDDLLMHILDPNREVAPNMINYQVATVDGRVVTGLIALESANALTLKRAEGATDVVSRSQIDEVKSTGMSLMPEGLEKEIPAESMADLIAYLRNLQPSPSAPARR